jgi:competence protein ComEC
VAGVVLGDEQALSEGLRNRFRASGLYHLLAVSGQNVALVAAGALALAWLFGLPRWLGQAGAIGAIASYVLAVGAQPSVVRAGVAGVLGSLAWLAARPADRWYFLCLGALVLLAWNPYDVLDAGFQLSFVAVCAIFALVPRIATTLEGYPLPRKLAAAVAVSTACGIATAPILWVQFQAVPLLTVPANALAEPAVAPLLYLAFGAGLTSLLFPPAAAVIAWLNGWCAAYLAGCARLFGSLPGAQIRSGRALLLVLVLGAAGGAYAWRRWQSSPPST